MATTKTSTKARAAGAKTPSDHTPKRTDKGYPITFTEGEGDDVKEYTVHAEFDQEYMSSLNFSLTMATLRNAGDGESSTKQEAFFGLLTNLLLSDPMELLAEYTEVTGKKYMQVETLFQLLGEYAETYSQQ